MFPKSGKKVKETSKPMLKGSGESPQPQETIYDLKKRVIRRRGGGGLRNRGPCFGGTEGNSVKWDRELKWSWNLERGS